MRIFNCSSCGNATSLIGSKKHFVENIEMDLYMCVSCGKVEFYKSNFEIPEVKYIKCGNCGNEVSDMEKICPYCDEII